MKRLMILFAALAFSATLGAQGVGIKANLLYGATLTPNLGIEIGMGKKTTLDISGGYNPFQFDDHKQWKHWLVQPEFRYWLCERFNGTFFGVHALGGEYNYANVELPFGLEKGLRDHRYEGYYYGGGITFGHQWIIGKRWNLEASIGVGYARVYYEKYECEDCSPRLEDGYKNYFGPTKAAISFILFL